MELTRIVFLLGLFACSRGNCPSTDVSNHLYRIGETQFYIVHHPDHSNNIEHSVNWKGAFKKCADRNMTMVRVDSITAFAEIAIPLSHLIAKLKLMDTWYWIPAMFDNVAQQYRWFTGTNMPSSDLLKFTNYFYRINRPIGVGGQKFKDTPYNSKSNITQCLTFAFPWPGLRDGKGAYGHAASFDERACDAVQGYHALCQVEDPNCKAKDQGPYVLSKGKEDYFEKGNWIIGNRRYIVNWGQRNKGDSIAYCRELGLKLFEPIDKGDICLIPFLKMWSRNITLSHFWTNMRYEKQTQSFVDSVGNVRAQGSYGLRPSQQELNLSRSSKDDTIFCVSMAFFYEFKNQYPCPEHLQNQEGSCLWNYIEFMPANCLNPQATICQHFNAPSRQCHWKKEYVRNMTAALVDTAVLPLGYDDQTEYQRSTYKQTFGNMYCPRGYNLVRETNTDWLEPPRTLSGDKIYDYDYRETYWVVDSEKFDKRPGSTCSISVNTRGYTREIRKVSCVDWHFYLCQRISPQAAKRPSPPPPGFSFPTWKFNNEPTPRFKYAY